MTWLWYCLITLIAKRDIIQPLEQITVVFSLDVRNSAYLF